MRIYSIRIVNMNALTFMLASPEDAAQISEINNGYIGVEDEGGFLVIPYSQDELLQLLDQELVTFFLVKDPAGTILGYVEVADRFDLSLIEQMNWVSSEARKIAESILSKKYVYVKQLAVRRGYQRQGIASFIYEMLEQHLKAPIVVFAAIEPKRNEASIQFHIKHGFTKVSALTRYDFGEFPLYRSYFFIRQV